MIQPSLYMKRDPAYSLAGRFEVIIDKSVKPGPGVYYPEKVTCWTAWPHNSKLYDQLLPLFVRIYALNKITI